SVVVTACVLRCVFVSWRKALPQIRHTIVVSVIARRGSTPSPPQGRFFGDGAIAIAASGGGGTGPPSARAGVRARPAGARAGGAGPPRDRGGVRAVPGDRRDDRRAPRLRNRRCPRRPRRRDTRPRPTSDDAPGTAP